MGPTITKTTGAARSATVFVAGKRLSGTKKTEDDVENDTYLVEQESGLAALKTLGYETEFSEEQRKNRFDTDGRVCVLGDIDSNRYYSVMAIGWAKTGFDDSLKENSDLSQFTHSYAYAVLEEGAVATCDMMILKEEHLTSGPLWDEGEFLSIETEVPEKGDIKPAVEIEAVAHHVHAGWMYRLTHAEEG